MAGVGIEPKVLVVRAPGVTAKLIVLTLIIVKNPGSQLFLARMLNYVIISVDIIYYLTDTAGVTIFYGYITLVTPRSSP